MPPRNRAQPPPSRPVAACRLQPGAVRAAGRALAATVCGGACLAATLAAQAPVAARHEAPGQAPEVPTRAAVATPLAAGEGALIVLDGALTESAWREAPALGNLRQRDPDEGAPASEATEVRVLFDATTLYVGVLARDREPARVVARILQRDQVLEPSFPDPLAFAGDDAVALLLDPAHDHRNAVLLATNANGAEFDALVTDEGREVNVAWRGIWRVAARRTPEGWSAEFAIPFRTLRATSPDGRWGFNVARVVRRRNEESLLTAWRRSEGLLRVSRAMDLVVAPVGAGTGLGVDVKPWVLAGAASARGDSGAAGSPDAMKVGLDVKYELRPGLVLDGTLNTDFAQAEADDERVNLTRFSLFVPEKREFFLENAGIFAFGMRQPDGTPDYGLFFSRRIGLADDGPVPVRGGLRLTGRAGRQTGGFLVVATRGAFDQPSTNFAVGRLKRDVGGSGYVGAMVADRRWSGGANTAGGVDFSLWPTPALALQGFAARTVTTAVGPGDAYGLSAQYRTGRVTLVAHHLYVGPDADAQTGFIQRTDVRRTSGFGWYVLRPRVLGVRAVAIGAQGSYVTRTSGTFQDGDAGAFAQVVWHSGAMLVLFHDRIAAHLDEGFDLADSLPIPAGDYRNRLTNVYLGTSPAGSVEAFGYWAVQRFYGGRMTTASATVRASAGRHLALRVTYTRNAVRLPSGSLDADVAQGRVTLALTTRLDVNALFQYNAVARRASANVRAHWTYRPGSDIYLVLNEERGSESSAWPVASRTAQAKVTWLLGL